MTPTQHAQTRDYLGDGVYARFDGYAIVLKRTTPWAPLMDAALNPGSCRP